jgi:T4-like virus Myoviridae tail sheath stabiliser
MLNNAHFYYKLMRKYVVIMGNMFNNINVIRYEKDSDVEISRFKVPISYGPKDKFVTRFESDPDLMKETQTILPRMSFELTKIEYDPQRQQNPLARSAKGNGTTTAKSAFMGVPYDFMFEVNLYAKTIDDGNHIIEQILPYFNPDYTVTVTPIAELGFMKDIPIILTSVTQNIQYEGNFDQVRYVYWTLTFTLRGYLFGPITTPKIIRKSIANIFNDPSLVAGYVVRMNMANGNNGRFMTNDTVYQGSNYQTANAYGTVLTWDANTAKLIIGGAQGQFKVDNIIRGMSTNAAYTLESFETTPLKLATITVEPDPITAQPEDDFGYTVSVSEWPETANV